MTAEPSTFGEEASSGLSANGALQVLVGALLVSMALWAPAHPVTRARHRPV